MSRIGPVSRPSSPRGSISLRVWPSWPRAGMARSVASARLKLCGSRSTPWASQPVTSASSSPALYWRWQDYDWKKPGEGKVDVGEVMTDAQGVLTDPNEPVAEPGDPVEPAIPEGDERR